MTSVLSAFQKTYETADDSEIYVTVIKGAEARECGLWKKTFRQSKCLRQKMKMFHFKDIFVLLFRHSQIF